MIPILETFILLVGICAACGYKFALYNVENPHKKNVALTFDDGPHGTLTPRLLDVLKQKNAHATFYVMGIKVQYHPDILRRMVAEGHEVGNHAWNHPVVSKLSISDVHAQVSSTAEAIANVTGVKPRTFRPPYGNTNNGLNKYIQETEGATVVIWSLDTLDWKRPKPADIVKQAVSKIKPGGIILCHDVHPGTIEAIPLLIDELQKAGYSFVTVSEMQDQLKQQSQNPAASRKLLRG